MKFDEIWQCRFVSNKDPKNPMMLSSVVIICPRKKALT